jgi:hypothetical protein
MSDQKKPEEGRKPVIEEFAAPTVEKESDPVITRLAIPTEMIDDPLENTWKKQKLTGAQIALSAMKLLAGVAWVIAVLSIAFRAVNVSTDYSFFRVLFHAEGGHAGLGVSVKRGLAMVASGAMLASGLACGVGALLCARGASKHPIEGRVLLILAAVSAGIAAGLYFIA